MIFRSKKFILWSVVVIVVYERYPKDSTAVDMFGVTRQKSISLPPVCDSCGVGSVSTRLMRPSCFVIEYILYGLSWFCYIVLLASMLKIISFLWSIFF